MPIFWCHEARVSIFMSTAWTDMPVIKWFLDSLSGWWLRRKMSLNEPEIRKSPCGWKKSETNWSWTFCLHNRLSSPKRPSFKTRNVEHPHRKWRLNSFNQTLSRSSFNTRLNFLEASKIRHLSMQERLSERNCSIHIFVFPFWGHCWGKGKNEKIVFVLYLGATLPR